MRYVLPASINGISLHNKIVYKNYMFLHEYLPFFYVILKNIIKTGITLLHMTILLIIVVVICQQMRITVKLSFIITFKDRH